MHSRDVTVARGPLLCLRTRDRRGGNRLRNETSNPKRFEVAGFPRFLDFLVFLSRRFLAEQRATNSNNETMRLVLSSAIASSICRETSVSGGEAERKQSHRVKVNPIKTGREPSADGLGAASAF